MGNQHAQRIYPLRNEAPVPFEEATIELLRQVHISMPWRALPKYREMILKLQMNVEIGLQADELDRLTRADLQPVAERLRQSGCRVTLHGPFWDLCPGSIDPLIRQVTRLRLQQLMDVIKVFEPIQVVCHTGFDPRHHRGHRELWLERSIALWEPLVEQAEALGVPILLENVWEHQPELHAELFRRIPSAHFGFCLDVGHQNSFSKAPLGEWLDILSESLMEIHLHDNDGSQDAHLPVGQGTVDFPALFDFLNAHRLDPLLTLEPHREEHLHQTLQGLQAVKR